MPHPVRARRGLFLVAIFLASLFLSAAVARRFLPFPKIAGIEPKVAWLAQHGAAYDTLFVGSSRIFWEVIPQEFDAAMARAGPATRSFNLAYKSVRPPEDSYLLEQVLATREAPLRFVIVEGDEVAMKIREEFVDTSRLAYWHDPRRMRALARHAQATTGTDARWWANLDERRDAFELLSLHIGSFFTRATNLGRGEALLLPQGEPRNWNKLVGVLRDGFTEGRDDTLSSRDAEHLRLGLLKRIGGPEVAMEASQRLFGDMERRIEATGARMVVVVPPRVDTGGYLPDPHRFPRVLVLDFSDPARYPELYEARHRRDADHLNLEGAAVFTRLLAARLIAER